MAGWASYSNASAVTSDDSLLMLNSPGSSPAVQQATAAVLRDFIGAVEINPQTGTTYTLALADVNKVVEASNASAITVTVPPNSSVAFPVGSVLEVCQTGAGQVTVAPGSGVTLNSPAGALKTRVQYSSAVLRKRATDTWIVQGDTTA